MRSEGEISGDLARCNMRLKNFEPKIKKTRKELERLLGEIRKIDKEKETLINERLTLRLSRNRLLIPDKPYSKCDDD